MWERIKEHKIFWLGFGVIFILGGLLLFSWLFPSRPTPAGKAPGAVPALTPPPALSSVLPREEVAPVVNPAATPLASFWAQLPRTVNVWEVASPSAAVDSVVWARRFGFTGAAVDEGLGVWRWTGLKKIFRFDIRDNYLTYLNLGLVEKGSLTLEQLQAKARFYLKEAGLDPNSSFELLNSQFKNGGEAEIANVYSLDAADRVLFTFTPTVDGLPLIPGSGDLDPTQIVLDRSGKMLTLRHYLWNYTLTGPRSRPLKDYTTALRELSEGKGKVAAVAGLGVAVPQLTDVRPARVRLAYLFPATGDRQLWPVLVFDGSAQDNSGVRVNATVLLWAAGGN